MKKNILLLLASAASIICNAQNAHGTSKDIDNISLTPILIDGSNYPKEAESAVKNKLSQVITQFGLGNASFDQRFVLTANFVELTKEATASAPPMIAIELSPSLYIGDISDGTLFASCSLSPIKGVGNNESKAYIAAVKSLKLTDKAVADFIEEGKQRIINYYDSQIDMMISTANAYAKQADYDGAIALLANVPQACTNAYPKAVTAIETIYQKKIDSEGAILLNNARQVWSASQSFEGAQEAAEFLSQINPESSNYSDAAKLTTEIAKRVKELDNREWNFKLQQHNDEIKLESQAIEAAKAIGVAKAKQPITYNTKVYWW